VSPRPDSRRARPTGAGRRRTFAPPHAATARTSRGCSGGSRSWPATSGGRRSYPPGQLGAGSARRGPRHLAFRRPDQARSMPVNCMGWPLRPAPGSGSGPCPRATPGRRSFWHLRAPGGPPSRWPRGARSAPGGPPNPRPPSRPGTRSAPPGRRRLRCGRAVEAFGLPSGEPGRRPLQSFPLDSGPSLPYYPLPSQPRYRSSK
jgi:hypothetical protein